MPRQTQKAGFDCFMGQDKEQRKEGQAAILLQQFLTLSTANMFQVKICTQHNNNPLILSLSFSFRQDFEQNKSLTPYILKIIPALRELKIYHKKIPLHAKIKTVGTNNPAELSVRVSLNEKIRQERLRQTSIDFSKLWINPNKDNVDKI